MKIRLRKPLGAALVVLWGEERLTWEETMSQILGFSIKLPQYFWEVELMLVHDRAPGSLTLECSPGDGWMSVFYLYNLDGDLIRYIEQALVRYCKRAFRQNYLQRAG